MKITMLATLLAGLAMGATAAGNVGNSNHKDIRDTKIIVEVNRSLETLTSQGVKNVQKIVLRP